MDKAKTPKVAKKKQETSKTGVSSAFDPSQPLENEGHERFCLEVLNRKPNVKAYQLAFPESTYDSARSNSSRLIADDNITARIAHLKIEQRERVKMSADDVIAGIEAIACGSEGKANLRALELLAKHHNLITDRVEHCGKITLEDLLCGDA